MISLELDGIEILDGLSVCAAVEESMPFLRQRASRFFSWSPAADQDDLVQEAAIGFWGALSSYDPKKAVPFGLYACRCVDNRLRSFSRAQRRKKRFPAGGFAPLEEEALEAVSSFPCESVWNPEELVIVREGFESLMEQINFALSDFEREVLALYLYGCGLAESSSHLHVTPKQIDNAMQRVKRKCRILLSE